MPAALHQPPIRAEHIGSLVRPPALLAARRERQAGRTGAKALRAAEDAAIRDAVKLQDDLGYRAVTDGEFRRASYSDSFTTSGIRGVAMEMTDDEGWRSSATHGHRMARRIPKVAGRIEWAGPQNREDYAFLHGQTKGIGKITLPGPAYIHYRAGRANISKEIYPDLEAFWTDLVGAYHLELQSLAEAGCSYVQLDETSLVKLGDERVRALLRERGDDWKNLLHLYIDVLNRVIAGAPDSMTIGVHVCRSQDPNWQADTGYEPIAEAMFNTIATPIFFLEYDNERAGSFEPLRAVPPGKLVVLGLVATKIADVEPATFLARRIEEAARFVPLGQLALSPQCGFATGVNMSDEAKTNVQRLKLARIAEVARDVWGAM